MRDVRRPAVVMAAALAATAALALGREAGAQAVAPILVVPATADPGGVVTVSNGPEAPCPPPGGSERPSASVDLFAQGSATPANRAPYQGLVTRAGTWSVEVRLSADLPPGTYRVQAGCYTDSGLNSGFGPAYRAGSLDLRLQDPGQPTASTRRARPGDSIQVESGAALCPPPAGSPSPRVRVSLLDAQGATRAESEAPVDARTGRWSVALRVPDLGAQYGQITAVCLARVAAPAPYARYKGAPLAIEAAPPAPTTTTGPPATSPPTTPAPGAATSVPTTSPPASAVSLPPTPVAVAVVAEPTYTG